MEKCFLVNVDRMTIVGAADSVEEADAAGQSASFDYDVLSTDEAFEKRYNMSELHKLYLNLGGDPEATLSGAENARRRILKALEDREVKKVATKKTTSKKKVSSKKKATSKKAPARKSAAKKAPVKKAAAKKAEGGYKNHRAGSRKGKAHEYFDTTKNLTRKAFINFCETELSIAPTTAGSWYQAFRAEAGEPK